MYQHLYFIDKSTGTSADVLATYGLAKILDEILAQALGRGVRRRVWIQDAGPYYQIELDQPVKPEWIESCMYFPFCGLCENIKDHRAARGILRTGCRRDMGRVQ